MRYGRLDKQGRLIPAPPTLKIEQTFPPVEEGGEPIISLQNIGNPTPEQYAEAGYYPIRETAMPEAPEGSHYEDEYTQAEGEIVQAWTLVEDPPPDPDPEISAERALNIILTGVDSGET